MYEDVKNYINSCDSCQKRIAQVRKEMLVPLEVKESFHCIGIDIKGLLPITSKENRYIIVAMDYFTKWSEARVIPDIKADTVAQFIYEKIICHHSVPKEVLSDRRTSFV